RRHEHDNEEALVVIAKEMSAVRRLAVPLFVFGLMVATTLPAHGEEIDLVPPDAPNQPPSPTAPSTANDATTTPPTTTHLAVTITDGGKTLTCREQGAQPFLVRGNWFPKTQDSAKVKEGRRLLDDAIKYRTEKYGHFEGFGNAKLNAHPPKYYAKSTTFMGM